MNDFFSIKRFAIYAKKHYVENCRFYLLLVAITALYLFLSFVKFNFFNDSDGSSLNIGNITNSFNRSIRYVYFILIWAIAQRSSTWIHKKTTSLNHYLLPISTFEKFVFVVLNSTLGVYLIANVVLAIPLAELAECFYLFDPETGTYYKKSLMSVFKSFGGSQTESLNFEWESSFVVPLYLAMMAVWGSVSMQKNGVLKSLLMHVVLLFIVVTVGVNLLVQSDAVTALLKSGSSAVNSELNNIVGFNVLSLSGIFNELKGVMYIFYTLFIGSYLYVIWLKMKRKELIS